MSSNGEAATTTLHLVRTVAATREQVFRAWTDPAVLARWWWPKHFATTFAIDLRVGGYYTIRSADLPKQGPLVVSGTFLEVTPPERLVYTWHWQGQDETETQVTVEFRQRGHQTEITLTHERFADASTCENNRLGWESCLDRLEQALLANTLPV